MSQRTIPVRELVGDSKPASGSNNHDIQKAWFMSDIKTRILLVAFELSDDPNYSREMAIRDLVKITEPLDVEGQIIVDE